jgi:hypothetical protein
MRELEEILETTGWKLIAVASDKKEKNGSNTGDTSESCETTPSDFSLQIATAEIFPHQYR